MIPTKHQCEHSTHVAHVGRIKSELRNATLKTEIKVACRQSLRSARAVYARTQSSINLQNAAAAAAAAVTHTCTINSKNSYARSARLSARVCVRNACVCCRCEPGPCGSSRVRGRGCEQDSALSASERANVHACKRNICAIARARTRLCMFVLEINDNVLVGAAVRFSTILCARSEMCHRFGCARTRAPSSERAAVFGY